MIVQARKLKITKLILTTTWKVVLRVDSRHTGLFADGFACNLLGFQFFVPNSDMLIVPNSFGSLLSFDPAG